jgi:hypothetical protein
MLKARTAEVVPVTPNGRLVGSPPAMPVAKGDRLVNLGPEREMGDLLDDQRLLQKEADKVVEVLQLQALLSDIGNPIRVGSSAMGLMVRRDVDITVVCEGLSTKTHADVSQVAAKLISQPRMVCLRSTTMRPPLPGSSTRHPTAPTHWLAA